MEDEKRNVVNNFEAGSNCQVFNGDISGCIFAMPGSNVTQQGGDLQQLEKEKQPQETVPHNQTQNEEQCHFIHPEVGSDEERAWQIHNEIKRLVSNQGIQEICQYLSQMEKQQKILLPPSADKAYNELVRMGMPNGEGYNIKTFMKYYKK